MSSKKMIYITSYQWIIHYIRSHMDAYTNIWIHMWTHADTHNKQYSRKVSMYPYHSWTNASEMDESTDVVYYSLSENSSWSKHEHMNVYANIHIHMHMHACTHAYMFMTGIQQVPTCVNIYVQICRNAHT